MVDTIKDVVIMNFSHVYEEEETLHKEAYQWIDCTEITGTDCYLEECAEKMIEKKIKVYPPTGIHFIDSGNYHYVTKLWTDKIKEPFSLLVFDHHTDMQDGMFAELISCGSWVKKVIEENPYVKKVILLGAKEELIDQIEDKYKKRVICYSEHQMKEPAVWKAFSKMHLSEPVYISVDKDVLSRKEAVTNWDQGSLTLQELEALLETIFEKERVIGIDICGEAALNEPLMLHLQETAINNKVNEELLACMEGEEQKKYEEASNY